MKGPLGILRARPGASCRLTLPVGLHGRTSLPRQWVTCTGCCQPEELTGPGRPGILFGFVSMAGLSFLPRGQSDTAWLRVPGQQKWMFTKDHVHCVVWPRVAGIKRHLGIPGAWKLCPRRQTRASPFKIDGTGFEHPGLLSCTAWHSLCCRAEKSQSDCLQGSLGNKQQESHNGLKPGHKHALWTHRLMANGSNSTWD